MLRRFGGHEREVTKVSGSRASAVGSVVLLPVRNRGTRNDGGTVCHPQRGLLSRCSVRKRDRGVRTL